MVGRRLLAIIAVVCALAVQIYAPVGSSWAMGAASDPLASAIICQHDPAGTSSDESPALPLSHNECCGLCALAHGGALPALAPDVIAIFVRIPRAADWSRWVNRLASTDIAEHARARAPPQIS